MDKKKLFSLISSCFIIASAVVILLALFVPYMRYVFTEEAVDYHVNVHTFYYNLFDSGYAEELSNHFRKISSRDWLMLVSDIMIILGTTNIVLTAILGILEGLSFVSPLNAPIKKFKNWFGLGILILGGLFVLLSLTFFLFSNNVYKSGTPNSGYYINHFQGSFGWWFMAVCPILGGLLAFRKGFKKFNIQTV